MPVINCEGCGAEVTAGNALRRFCAECLKARRRTQNRERLREVYTPRQGTVDLTCQGCGVTWRSRNNRGTWCPTCRGTRSRDLRRRAYALKHEYGITEEIYTRMHAEQGGKCAICSKPEEVLCVDHSHISGNVRGLLCRSCNSALGHLGDTAESLQRAADYLHAAERAEGNTE